MLNTSELFKEAENNGICVFYGSFPACKGICSEGFIGMDYDLAGSEEKTCLAHELGHCLTGAFYAARSSQLERRRAERKADAWAIKKLAPADELERAIMNGRSFYELMELFGVSAEFLQKALEYYAERGQLLSEIQMDSAQW